MQPSKMPASRSAVYDADILQASNVSGFKDWLIRHGYQVQTPSPTAPSVLEAKRGVIFWVVLTKKKSVCVREGRGVNNRYVETHTMLRGFLDRFLANPMASAVKAVVRPEPAAPRLPVVKSVKVAPLSLKKPQQAGNDADQGPRYLLSESDIKAAMQSKVVGGCHYVIGVRVAAGVGPGRTVATLMRVSKGAPAVRQVQVIKHVLISDGESLNDMAHQVAASVPGNPGCTILVDQMALGTQFMHLLSEWLAPSVKRFGLLLGAAPGGKDNKRYVNQRASCATYAAEAIKRGDVELVGGDSEVTAYGSRIPYTVDDQARIRVRREDAIEANPDQYPDLFEALSLAFAPIDFANPPPGVQPLKVAPFNVPLAPPKLAPVATPAKVDAYLTDLRDDFAVNCPLVQGKDEDMTAFVDRCWKYADLMVKRRPDAVRG